MTKRTWRPYLLVPLRTSPVSRFCECAPRAHLLSSAFMCGASLVVPINLVDAAGLPKIDNGPPLSLDCHFAQRHLLQPNPYHFYRRLARPEQTRDSVSMHRGRGYTERMQPAPCLHARNDVRPCARRRRRRGVLMFLQTLCERAVKYPPGRLEQSLCRLDVGGAAPGEHFLDSSFLGHSDMGNNDLAVIPANAFEGLSGLADL